MRRKIDPLIGVAAGEHERRNRQDDDRRDFNAARHSAFNHFHGPLVFPGSRQPFLQCTA
jgi:hypothetical protein